MNIDHRRILGSFDKILEKNKNFVQEVAASSTELFGGPDVKIPRAGAHAGQKGWASSNAWDIPAAIGTPVYAIADGTVITFKDYGSSIIKTGGKKLYGIGFTVESDGGLPDVYYTHLENVGVSKGDKVQCGQFLGYIMDMPGSSYDHVHIGIERGDISQFLTSDGKLRCGGGTITGEVGGPAPTKDTSSNSNSPSSDFGGTQKPTEPEADEFNSDFGEIIGKKKPKQMTESFGKDVQQSYEALRIPAKKNSKIYSPVEGVVDNSRYARGCKNEVTIKINDSLGYLQYCGISNPKVSHGDKIKVGALLGSTSDDVEVVHFNTKYQRQKLKDNSFNNSMFGKKPEEKTYKSKYDDDYKIKSKPEPTYYDPAMALIPSMITGMFKDKVDPETGQVEKRMGYATDKKPVDPWIVNSLSKPFVKIGKALGTNKSDRLKENIERIKKLLK